MLTVLIIALLLLAYVTATSKSRNLHTSKPVEWVTPGNGYGRHGAHSSKKF